MHLRGRKGNTQLLWCELCYEGFTKKNKKKGARKSENWNHQLPLTQHHLAIAHRDAPAAGKETKRYIYVYILYIYIYIYIYIYTYIQKI